MFCKSHSLTVHSPGRVGIHVLACKTWDCEDCRKVRLRQLRDLAASGAPSKLITLTVDPARHESPDEAAQALVRAWRNVLQRGKREGRFGHIAYLAVFEEHKSGWPHLHILARAPYIPQTWLSDRMEEYTGGFRCDIRAVHNRRYASRYIAKYVSKGPGRFDGCKRYWRSQDYQQSPTGWEKEQPVHDRLCLFHTRSIHSLRDSFMRAGWTVVDHSDGFVEALRPNEAVLDPWLDALCQQLRAPPDLSGGRG